VIVGRHSGRLHHGKAPHRPALCRPGATCERGATRTRGRRPSRRHAPGAGPDTVLDVIGCACSSPTTFIHYDAIRAVRDLRGRDDRLVHAGAGALVYTLGLRHAFDADPISAIDDTTRYLLQKDRKPLVVGFFFSLGHSTVVLAFVTALALVASRATWL